MTAERDHQAEQDDAEFAGWAEAQGYDDGERYDFDEMREAFTAGMQAERDLAAQPQPAPDFRALVRDNLIPEPTLDAQPAPEHGKTGAKAK